MGLPILVIGKSGMGKSASLRNFDKDKLGVVNVLGKALPFQNDFNTIQTDNYSQIKQILLGSKVNTLVIDDAGYLITNQFMRGHAGGKGSSIFDLYNQMGDNFWELINFISYQLPNNKIVYLFMHEDKNELGDIKPKTIGRMLDEKVCVEGMFTIVLRAVKDDGKYVFSTQSNGFDVAKTPIGLFESQYIDNDLRRITNEIRRYYKMEEM